MDIRDLDRRSLGIIDKLLAGATEADLGRPTPCAGWDLAELLRHQISENHAFATAAREGSAPDWDGGTLGDDAFAAYSRSAEDALTAFDEGTAPTMTIREFGDFPAAIALRMHLVDSVAHGWDIARALGLPYEPDAEALAEALRFVENIPTDREPGGSFAPVVPTPPAASDLDRFLGLLGRDPAWVS
ncbi:TIGR03086 family protein [Amycolatopsis xylanica]|uniref:TIGR03086 family protein n=1 Tax=Amycolatopsis xylanica TaxID=589385 RepID=A0A1H3Q2P8_9PSEU|nr:TIGR03086 family metal-binding protein [Amycolatopsis xylanica]SDZ07656.1 TIGR03086 family protein [Amycolatopsis xylanica]